jgi:TDG/mug DNA glycosylase family protein
MTKAAKFTARSNIRQNGGDANRGWEALRLRDRIRPDVRLLLVGINPGVRSAITGHHFAGFSNRFWKLLWEARIVPEPITFEDDDRLPEWGIGITNLIARPTPGINDLRPAEYVEGWRVLERKIARFKPPVVALVGVTLYRAILPLLLANEDNAKTPPRRSNIAPLTVGLQKARIGESRLFVLPNPSGRNANFTYAEMLDAFTQLSLHLRSSKRRGPSRT